MDAAFECFEQATKCEKMAAGSRERTWRIALLAEARNWRRLGVDLMTKQSAEVRAELAESNEASAPAPRTN
jgi:hypothetical protein